MGRSKFPGKPSKHVNRKRINVLPANSDSETFIIECGRPVTVENDAETQENKQVDRPEQDKNETGGSNNINSKVSSRRLSRKMQGNNSNKHSLMSKLCNKNSVKSVVKIKKNIRRYSAIKSFKQCRSAIVKEGNSLVGKFILPKRSVHSSRVIKPNKRFINVDLTDTLTLKKAVLRKRHCIQQSADKIQAESPSLKSLSIPQVETAAAAKSTSNLNINNNNKTRIILRQARLKLHSQTPSGADGPFSSNFANSSPPGTVTCGVCGAVRFYRFVKQARKFNIYSCESCRKFISKMIKRQNCGKSISSPALVCHKGQGTCHVPPIVRSQQMKLIKCPYRSRCPACWLKMCLRSFQMPMSLKHSLVQLLPKNMQAPDVILTSSLPLLFQQNGQNQNSSVGLGNKIEDVKARPVRFKNPKKFPQAPCSDIKRQKVDLKGPRVKHVCRSASIVLGQPLATFPGEVDKKKVEENKEIVVEIASDNSKQHIIPASKNDVKTDTNSSENDYSDSDKCGKLPLIVNDAFISNVKRDKLQRVPFSTSLVYENKSHIDKKQNLQDHQNMISIDFIENYDTDDLTQNGFCLIASQQFSMPAICFICGSAGREALLHCSLCCEPYHPFCLEQCPPVSNNNNRQFMWLCPRCTTCTACNQTDRQKLNCQKCSKAYHSECFNTKWAGEDKLMICSKCLTCKSCGQENTAKFVGNLPLCVMCFKLRKTGNLCPVCQGSYDNADSDEKMMECTKCQKWIHAKCEGLSEEYYHILSTLPESVKYLCIPCSNQLTPYWRKAVESELKFNFNQIIRLLSKNRTAKNILKSPLNNHSSLSKNITNVRKIQFSTDNTENCTNPSDMYTFVDSELSNDSTVMKTVNEQKYLNMLDIKNKLNANEYNSVRIFNEDMLEALKNTHSDDLLSIYYLIFQSVFPWYKSHATTTDDVKLDECSKRQYQNFSYIDEDICDQVECVAVDSRYCSFCKSIGDGLSHLESRLLYCGHNDWVHINCALWSSEVYEEIDGALQNVHNALSRGRLMRCSYCKQKGATVGCCFKNCYETYHFICARTAKCYFMHDKTIYCGNHELSKDAEINIITKPTDFYLRRSVSVEFSDSKKEKFSQIEKVNVMVGSLCVSSLGKINQPVSDNAEAIIPTDYVCSRLFWSVTEPWRLVPYKISTSILNSHVNSLYIDKNFTVDHTLPRGVVERKLKEIVLWHKDIDKKKADVDFDDEEEPQNSADLLSPELTDAIFEELPHELLDGISVQDIFPKLMSSYEDFINMDCKPETDLNNLDFKKSHEIDNLARELDDNSEISKNTNKKQQRSCSLTLSCKLDNTFSPVLKKRKITPRENNLIFQLLQVDGNFDDSSSSECDSPTGIDDGNSVWDIKSSEEPVTCERCQCTYRTQASYRRHLDTCEIITSESDSEVGQDFDLEPPDVIGHSLLDDSSTNLAVNIEETPTQSVVLTAYESYQNEIHTSVLNTQTFITSKSTELLIPQNDITQISLEQKAIDASQSSFTEQVPVSIQVAEDHTNRFCLNQCMNQTLPLQTPIINTNNSIVNQAIAVMNQQPVEYQQPTMTIQSLPYNNSITPSPIINVTPQGQITTFSEKMLTNSNIMNSVLTPNTNNRWVKQPVVKPSVYPTKIQKIITTKGPPRSIAAKNNETTIIVQPTTSTGQPMIVQHVQPSTGFIPTFVDAFQQQAGQNIQYLATITPTTQLQQPLVQLQTDTTNMISLLPGIQPTAMIIQQQPRVLENQLVFDSNGSLTWAPQVQPVYYGYETIVQNTVMQSQQLMPSTVPGVLTANSSYSTTTQVYQTSKLEPVLDLTGANSFVLLNSGQLVSSQPIQIVQNTQSQPISNNHNNSSSSSNSNNNSSNTFVSINSNIVPTTQVHVSSNTCSVNPQQHRPQPQHQQIFQKPRILANHSITLPTAPFVPEHGIPTNIVTPTPKPITSTQSRPMNRVLPMQTLIKEADKTRTLDKPDVKKNIRVQTPTLFKKNMPEITTEKEIIQRKNVNHVSIENKNESALKLVFQKESSSGSYKVSNNQDSTIDKPIINLITETLHNHDHINSSSFTSKTTQNSNSVYNKINSNFNNIMNCTSVNKVQVAPLKRIKSNFTQSLQQIHLSPLSEKQNRLFDNSNKKVNIETQPLKQVTHEKRENENIPSILYTIETQDGFKYTSTSVADLWTKVFEAVQNARAAHNMPLLPPDSTNIMSSLQILGLRTSALKYLIEQLPGAGKCAKYKPIFNFPSKFNEIEDEPIGHIHGSVRCVPNVNRNDPYDMFGWLASKHRKPEHSLLYSDLIPRRGSINNLPMAMRFRQLKLTSKYSVGVYRSKIHRRGLFCLRDFEAGEMVIEYSGEVIRSILTDKREKFYNSKGIGCYMFRIDDNLVVDATMTGNAARFINHSCDPNCYSKVVEILGHKHIIIFALRKIICGEELTYDYKFPIEEDKIPCTCGTRRCRKFLN